MRRYTFYLSVALLAFGISSFAVIQSYRQTVSDDLSIKVSKKLEIPFDNSKEENFKYGCEEKELESLWEKLDEELFFKFAQAQLKRSYKHYPEIYEIEWEHLLQRFHCSSFLYFKKEDLNNDGIEELFIRDSDTSLRDDRKLFVFREINGKWQPILFALEHSEIKNTERKYNGFPQITITSGYYRSGARRIDSFQFNGKFYQSVKCILKWEWIDDANGNIINLRKPKIEPCN